MTNYFQRNQIRALSWAIGSALLLLLFMYLSIGRGHADTARAATSAPAACTIPATPIHIRLSGMLEAAPENVRTRGAWVVRVRETVTFTVVSDDSTGFPAGVPAVGNQVGVHGLLQRDGSVAAATIYIWAVGGGRDGDVQLEIQGTIVGIPDSDTDENPAWRVSVTRPTANGSIDVVYRVLANDETHFGGGIPRIGLPIKVWGTLRSERQMVAQFIRLQEHSGGEDRVVQLRGVVSHAPNRQSGRGLWIMQSANEVLHVVRAMPDTAFPNGVPNVGQSVVVSGVPRLDGQITARTIAADGGRVVKLRGIVWRRPDGANGRGRWAIHNVERQTFQIIANAATVFDPDLPESGQLVEVVGIARARTEIQANTVRTEQPGDEIEIGGLVRTMPDSANGIGAWVLQVSRTATRTVIVDANTVVRPRLPRRFQWVSVRGVVQRNGDLRAVILRPDTYELGEIVVRLDTGVMSSTVASRYNLAPLETLLSSGQIYLFATPTRDDDIDTLIARMKADTDILWAEPNYKSRLPQGNPYLVWAWGGLESSGYVNQFAFEQIRATAAQTHFPGQDITVAILDTGLDLNHPAFSGRYLTGYDMIDDDTVPQDEGDGLAWGHGTHISGIIAQMAQESMLLPVRVLDANGQGNTYLLAYAVEWAVENGADVINMSLGSEGDSQLLRETIQAAIDKGVVIVAAAGNNNENTPQYPAAYDNVISVTAVDADNVKASFANYGGTWVSIAAPGEGITSTITGPQGSGVASWSGTSMAASWVSGAAAQARDKFPAATSQEIETLFVQTAYSLDELNPGYIGQLGGLLDVTAALVPDAVAPEYDIYLPAIIR